MKKRVVVICPGRGSYTKETLGYLSHRTAIKEDLNALDDWRMAQDLPSLSELDQSDKFKVSIHTKGEHASPLIYACAKADFLEISEEFEIVAVTGNSMGWYLTLAFAGALDPKDSFDLIQTMGSMMREELIGGQIIYPIIKENWQVDDELKHQVLKWVQEVNSVDGQEAYVSIHLGGYLVLAGDKKGLAELTARLPKKENYPFQLVNHGAFHTPMLKDLSERAQQELRGLKWTKPKAAMIDGRGQIWQPYSTDLSLLANYTLGHQVTETYDFTKAISVALKEFAPDHLILLGPGNSLGGAVGQIMIQNEWFDITSKAEFSQRQKEEAFLISMGISDQKKLASRN